MIIFKQQTNMRDRQRGVALLVVTFALLIITSIAAGMILLTNTETSISSNFRDQQLAFFSARAGIEEARDRMRNVTDNPVSINIAGTIPTTLPGTGTSVLYILNPANGETVAPWNGSVSTSYPDTEICSETTTITCSSGKPNLSACNTWCNSVTANSTYAASPVFDWKWVRITLKQNNSFTTYATNGASGTSSQTCWNGVNEQIISCALPNTPVYLLTSLAVTPTGSRRMIQAEIAADKLTFAVPGALTLDGTGDSFNAANSNNYGVNGNDTAGCGGPIGPAVPAVAVNDIPDKTTIVGAIPNGRRNNYQGSGATNPDVEAVTLPAYMQTPSALQTLVSTLKNNVTQPVISGPASNIAFAGSLASPQIIYVNGDLTLNCNVTGYWILVVTGTFTARGNVGWNGLVLVVGAGVYDAEGGGNKTYNGAILIAHTLDNSLNVLSTLGSPTYTTNGGGTNSVNYSSGCINRASNLSTYHDMAIREILD
jgi:Tfp pilus assembly protein PilX